MMTIKNLRPALLACAVLISLPAALAAGEPENDKETSSDSRIVIVHDDGDEIVIDMAAVNEIVHEAMEGVGDVMAELEDMQFQMHLGNDNRLNLSYEDTTFELDLDQVMAQVSVALEAGLANIDTEDWTYSRERWADADEQELRRELEKLKDEMRELKKELKKVKDD
jgi:hypothetical protein